MRSERDENPAANDHDIPSLLDDELVRQCDVKGVLHSHSRYCEGAHPLIDMVLTAREIGLEYLGVSDHLRCGRHPQGLDPGGFHRQREEIEGLRAEFPDFDIFQGVEVVADRNGNLACAEELLTDFDYVIVSLCDAVEADVEQQTARALRALRHPSVNILSKPAGAFMLDPPPWPLDMEAVLAAAGDAGVAVEIDANPQSAELDWTLCHQAQQSGVMLSINPNAYRAARLVDYRHGVELARQAGICCSHILNTMSGEQLRRYMSA